MKVLIYDKRWDSCAAPKTFQKLKALSDQHLSVDPICTLGGVESLSRKINTDSRITAFGGGGVLDTVKLAAWNTQAPLRLYAARGRAGIMTLPDLMCPHLTLVPTTLGTGSEANPKAIIEIKPGRRRMVISQSLMAAEYKHFPDVYASLSKRQVLYGIVEILFRSAGSFAVTEGVPAEQFLQFFVQAVEYGREAMDKVAPQNDKALMLGIARLSAATHGVEGLPKGILWSWPLWYLANELASAAQLTKLDATIALADSVFQRVGSMGYGTKASLGTLEATLGEPFMTFIRRLAGGLDTEVIARLSKIDTVRLSQQAVSQWAGANLPLGVVDLSTVVDIYRETQQTYA